MSGRPKAEILEAGKAQGKWNCAVEGALSGLEEPARVAVNLRGHRRGQWQLVLRVCPSGVISINVMRLKLVPSTSDYETHVSIISAQPRSSLYFHSSDCDVYCDLKVCVLNHALLAYERERLLVYVLPQYPCHFIDLIQRHQRASLTPISGSNVILET